MLYSYCISGHHTSRNWAIRQFPSFRQRWSTRRWEFRKVRFSTAKHTHKHSYIHKQTNTHCHKLFYTSFKSSKLDYNSTVNDKKSQNPNSFPTHLTNTTYKIHTNTIAKHLVQKHLVHTHKKFHLLHIILFYSILFLYTNFPILSLSFSVSNSFYSCISVKYTMHNVILHFSMVLNLDVDTLLYS